MQIDSLTILNGSNANESYPLTGGTVTQDGLQLILELVDVLILFCAWKKVMITFALQYKEFYFE